MLDANKIQIDVAGSKVTLKGKVRNYAEVEEAALMSAATSDTDNLGLIEISLDTPLTPDK